MDQFLFIYRHKVKYIVVREIEFIINLIFNDTYCSKQYNRNHLCISSNQNISGSIPELRAIFRLVKVTYYKYTALYFDYLLIQINNQLKIDFIVNRHY
jgi:hypothetical protein